jgi:predicted amidohydrolase
MRITLVQADWDVEDPVHNLAAVEEHVHRHRKSNLRVFPELAVHGHDVIEGVDAPKRDHLGAVLPEDVA